MDIRAVDLNLLPVLDALLRHRSATLAARELDMSQSALSSALGRLRTTLEDDLFVRTGRGLRPTARASQLQAPLAAILDQVKKGVLQAASFVPAASTREFRIGHSDVGAYVIWPQIVKAIQPQAPGLRLTLCIPEHTTLATALAENELDLAIGSFPRLPSTLYQQRLYERDYVGLVRRGHPLCGQALTLREFAAQPQIVVHFPSGIQERIDGILSRHGLRRSHVMEVPSCLVIHPLLQHSQYLSVVPGQLADALVAVGGVEKIPLPFQLEASVIRMHWHRRAHDDPGIVWLRQTIAGFLQQA